MDDLLVACEAGDWSTVAAILGRSPGDVNTRDVSGYTALHYAVSAGQRHVCEVLVALGADLNALNPTKGQTPLHCACNGSHQVRCARAERPMHHHRECRHHGV